MSEIADNVSSYLVKRRFSEIDGWRSHGLADGHTSRSSVFSKLVAFSGPNLFNQSTIDRMEGPKSSWAPKEGLKAGYGLSNF